MQYCRTFYAVKFLLQWAAQASQVCVHDAKGLHRVFSHWRHNLIIVRLEPEGDSFFFLHKIDYDKTKKNSNFSFLRQKTYVTYLNNISVIYQNNGLDEILMMVSKKW